MRSREVGVEALYMGELGPGYCTGTPCEQIDTETDRHNITSPLRWWAVNT